MEVMGLMLGEFVDDYTVRVADVFAMPQSGTGVSVEAVDPVFQTKMLDMLKQVGRSGSYLCLSWLQKKASNSFKFEKLTVCNLFGRSRQRLTHDVTCRRPEMVVGWYHSHPGFGCWLSGVDINTQQVSALAVFSCTYMPPCCWKKLGGTLNVLVSSLQSFEALNQRAVAVVVDPIQSVKGKVVIDAFRYLYCVRELAGLATAAPLSALRVTQPEFPEAGGKLQVDQPTDNDAGARASTDDL